MHKNAIQAGQVFGRLTVLEPAESKNRQARWKCACTCGTVKPIATASLLKGLTQSCGCLQRELTVERNASKRTHGMTGTKTYQAWSAMKVRCLNESSTPYPAWGGRGITIDPDWLVFANFLRDMGEAPEGLTLEREKNDLGYCKSNCVWAPQAAQANNTRANVALTFQGRTQTASRWARELGFTEHQILLRISRGWSTERALTTPVRNYRK